MPVVPFYEYRRQDGTTFEVMQSMSEPQLTEDPETGEPVQRVFHPIAVHFKGKGFYNTDYGTRNRQRETAANQEGTSKAEKKDAKGDAKSGSSSTGDSASKSSGSSDSSGSAGSSSGSSDSKSSSTSSSSD